MAVATWQYAVTTMPTASATPAIVAYLEKPKDIRYVRQRNGYCELTSRIDDRDDLNALEAAAYRRCLLALRNGTPRFLGQITEFEETPDGFVIGARDPFYNLWWRRVRADVIYTGTDAGQVAWNLIALQNGYRQTHLRQGTTDVSVNRTRSYVVGETVAEKVEYLTKLPSGFGFRIDAVYPVANVLAEFRVVYPIDVANNLAVFGYGDGTLENVADYTRTVRPLVNRVNVVGSDAGTVRSYENATGPATYGLWEDERAHVLTASGDTLAEIAQRNTEAVPQYEISLRPAANAPQLFTDFDVLQSVRVDLRRRGRTITGLKPVIRAVVAPDPDSGEEMLEELVLEDPDLSS